MSSDALCLLHTGRTGSAASFASYWVRGEVRNGPLPLNRALKRWNAAYGQDDESLTIDGKTMCNAVDEYAHQTHILGVVGHQSKICYTQKKWEPCQ